MSPTMTSAKSHAECHDETGAVTPFRGDCQFRLRTQKKRSN